MVPSGLLGWPLSRGLRLPGQTNQPFLCLIVDLVDLQISSVVLTPNPLDPPPPGFSSDQCPALLPPHPLGLTTFSTTQYCKLLLCALNSSFSPPPPPLGFSSDQCPEGFVAVVKSSLRILVVENVGDAFNQQVRKYAYQLVCGI